MECSIVWIHVDDGIVTGPSPDLLKALEDGLKGLLKIKWTPSLDSIMGLEIRRTQAGFCLQQPKLISQVLEEHWDGSTAHKTPL
jgi:hypothetical protein